MPNRGKINPKPQNVRPPAAAKPPKATANRPMLSAAPKPAAK